MFFLVDEDLQIHSSHESIMGVVQELGRLHADDPDIDHAREALLLRNLLSRTPAEVGGRQYALLSGRDERDMRFYLQESEGGADVKSAFDFD